MYADLSLEQFMEGLIKENRGEPEFHQAVYAVTESVIPHILEHPRYQHAAAHGRTNYVKGANIAGFVKVADAMLAYGVM